MHRQTKIKRGDILKICGLGSIRPIKKVSVLKKSWTGLLGSGFASLGR